MTQKLRKFGRLSSYALVLFAASLFSFILQFKNQKQDEHKIALVPPVPTVLADVPPSDGSGDNPSESASCACTCAADASSDGTGADGSDGDAGGNF